MDLARAASRAGRDRIVERRPGQRRRLLRLRGRWPAGHPGNGRRRGGGQITGAGGSGGAPVIPLPPSDLPPEKACTGNSPGPRQLRRLTAVEFAATVRDLFRDPTVPTAAIFNDQATLGFTVDSGALLIQDLVGDASGTTRRPSRPGRSPTTCGDRPLHDDGFGLPPPGDRNLRQAGVPCAAAEQRGSTPTRRCSPPRPRSRGGRGEVRHAAVAAFPLPDRAWTGKRRTGIDGDADALRGGKRPLVPAARQHARRSARAGRGHRRRVQRPSRSTPR